MTTQKVYLVVLENCVDNSAYRIFSELEIAIEFCLKMNVERKIWTDILEKNVINDPNELNFEKEFDYNVIDGKIVEKC